MAEESQALATITQTGDYRVLMDGATVDCPATALGGATYVVGERVTVTIRNPRRPLIEGVEDTILPEEDVEGPRTVPPRGTVMFWPHEAPVPAGWLKCDGAQYDSDEYPYLAQMYGGGATFFVPDYRRRFLLGADASAGPGATGGEENVTLTIAQMPAHAHGGMTGGGYTNFLRILHQVGSVDYTNHFVGGAGGAYHDINNTNNFFGSDHKHYLSSEGGGQSHNNMPPYAVGHWIIKA